MTASRANGRHAQQNTVSLGGKHAAICRRGASLQSEDRTCSGVRSAGVDAGPPSWPPGWRRSGASAAIRRSIIVLAAALPPVASALPRGNTVGWPTSSQAGYTWPVARRWKTTAVQTCGGQPHCVTHRTEQHSTASAECACPVELRGRTLPREACAAGAAPTHLHTRASRRWQRPWARATGRSQSCGCCGR